MKKVQHTTFRSRLILQVATNMNTTCYLYIDFTITNYQYLY